MDSRDRDISLACSRLRDPFVTKPKASANGEDDTGPGLTFHRGRMLLVRVCYPDNLWACPVSRIQVWGRILPPTGARRGVLRSAGKLFAAPGPKRDPCRVQSPGGEVGMRPWISSSHGNETKVELVSLGLAGCAGSCFECQVFSSGSQQTLRLPPPVAYSQTTSDR